MSSLNYINYSADTAGLSALASDLKSAFDWSSVEIDSETEKYFFLSTGAKIKLTVDNFGVNFYLSNTNGVEVKTISAVKRIGFLSTAKVPLYMALLPAADTTISNITGAAYTSFAGLAVSNGKNVENEAKCEDVLSCLITGWNNSNANTLHIENVYPINNPSDVSLTVKNSQTICYAIAAASDRSKIITPDIMSVILNPYSTLKIEGDVTINGTKYFQAGAFLIAK